MSDKPVARRRRDRVAVERLAWVMERSGIRECGMISPVSALLACTRVTPDVSTI